MTFQQKIQKCFKHKTRPIHPFKFRLKLAAESLLGLKHLRQTVGGYSKNIIEKQIDFPNFYVRHSSLKFKMSTFKTNTSRGISLFHHVLSIVLVFLRGS